MADDRFASIRHRYDRFHEISKEKHGIRQLPIEWMIELESDLEWCIAEIKALRIEVERLHHDASLKSKASP